MSMRPAGAFKKRSPRCPGFNGDVSSKREHFRSGSLIFVAITFCHGFHGAVILLTMLYIVEKYIYNAISDKQLLPVHV